MPSSSILNELGRFVNADCSEVSTYITREKDWLLSLFTSIEILESHLLSSFKIQLWYSVYNVIHISDESSRVLLIGLEMAACEVFQDKRHAASD